MNIYTRNIILGASLGIISCSLGVSKSYTISAGFGMFSGFLAALTASALYKKRQKHK